MFCTQRRDPEFILEELAETSSHCIPDLIDQAQGAGGEDEEKEKRKKKERKNRKKEEKKEGEAQQQKKKAHEGDETLLLSVLWERIPLRYVINYILSFVVNLNQVVKFIYKVFNKY